MHRLYGDGIHDDTLAIQERIDGGAHELVLPAPAVCYLISRPLTLPSQFRLVLPRYAEIRLADGANCLMVTNKSVPRRTPYVDGKDAVFRLLPEPDPPYAHRLYGYLLNRSDAPEDLSHDIEICGGVWNLNNMHQAPNPFRAEQMGASLPENLPDDYIGHIMLFYHTERLTLRNLTLKDPVTYAVTLDRVRYFTVSDIVFDFNMGNPLPWNTDGIHMNGNCAFGRIQNLSGACYDDLLALNADEGSGGPIHDIAADGIYAEDCHSAVRLLTLHHPVERIHIANVYGTYFQYCIGVTKFYAGEADGYFDAVSIDHVFAAKAERYERYGMDGTPWRCPVFPLFHFSQGVRVRRLRMAELHRFEEHVPAPTFCVEERAVIDQLVIDKVTVENRTGKRVPFFVNDGTIGELVLRDAHDAGGVQIEGNGTVGRLTVTP